MMKKLLCLAVLAVAGSSWAQHRVFVDGEEIRFAGVKPEMLNGRLMVPLRGIFEKMGIAIEWDAARELVTARKAPDLVELEVNSRIARINGQNVTMEVAPYHKNGRTMVPLRLIGQATGADVSFRNGAVRITSKREKS